ncbi:MAG: 50S ribosomal protein L25 [Akkermansiaceae bacterium]|jgi:large subunit ribosomal protein L25|nr:50S ribosomal protein L25 [Akkermansiaceae bacterium]
MAKKTTLKAAPRARTGSGRLTQMRREGWLPSVIYGRGAANLNLKVDAKSFGELLARSSSENIVVNLEIDGEGTRLAFLQAIQHDPLSGAALHADFLAIDSKTEITAHIPAHLNGEAPGVKAGGVIEQYVHAIEITCLPDDLPETIELDISKLELGDSLHVGEVTYPKGVRPTHAADVVIVHIGRAGSGAEAEAEAATTEAAATP